MVYCTKCGTYNPENAQHCSNCGSSLYTPESPSYASPQYTRSREESAWGSGVWLLIAGLFIVLIGLGALFDWNIWEFIWPMILIVVGIWIIVLGLRRNRRYRQTTP